jgi:hypothetical protein
VIHIGSAGEQVDVERGVVLVGRAGQGGGDGGDVVGTCIVIVAL